MATAPDSEKDIEYTGGSPLNGESKTGPSVDHNPAKKNQRLKKAAAGLFAACAIALFIRIGCGPPQHQLDHAAEAARLQRDARILAAALRESGSYDEVLLLTRPPRSSGYVPELVKAARKGLRQGFDGGIEIAAADAPKFTEEVATRSSGKELKDLPDLSKWLPPIGYWFDGEVLADIIEAHPSAI